MYQLCARSATVGADLAIDYTREKIGQASSQEFNMVLDGIGKSVWADFVSRAEGRREAGYFDFAHSAGVRRQAQVFCDGDPALAFGIVRGLIGGKRLLFTRVKPRGGELEKVSALIAAGKIRPVVEKSFSLEQIAEAHRLSEWGMCEGSWGSGLAKSNQDRITRGSAVQRIFFCSEFCVLRYHRSPSILKRLFEARLKEGITVLRNPE